MEEVTATLKTVKQVFKDYNTNSFALSEGKVACINVYKKTGTLEIKLKATSSIPVKDLLEFEKYLSKRFAFKEIEIKIENESKDENDDTSSKIKSEWPYIVEYMAYKHPLTKALLKDSIVEINENKLTVKLARKGQAILSARGFEKILDELNIRN